MKALKRTFSRAAALQLLFIPAVCAAQGVGTSSYAAANVVEDIV